MGPKISVPTIDSELLKEIQETAGKSGADIPLDYANERKNIVEEMRKADPKPYENLLYSDYPDKNGTDVNKLALTNVTSNQAKKQIADQINEQIKPKVDENTAGKTPFVRKAIQRAVEKAVEQAVEKSVDAAIKNINTNDTQNKLDD